MYRFPPAIDTLRPNLMIRIPGPPASDAEMQPSVALRRSAAVRNVSYGAIEIAEVSAHDLVDHLKATHIDANTIDSPSG